MQIYQCGGRDVRFWQTDSFEWHCISLLLENILIQILPHYLESGNFLTMIEIRMF